MLNPEQIKAENIAKLMSWRIPVNKHLPTLESESELAPQSSADVARGCMVISHVIGIGFGGDTRKLQDAVRKYGLSSYVSDQEQDMLSRTTHSEQEKIDATWRVECMQSFAWCLGLAELDIFRSCDEDLASRFPAPFSDPSRFIESAKLRPFEEIYRQADLHYRLHWAARNARLSGEDFTIPEGLIGERRKALDWTMGVEPDWDEVPSDT